MSEISDLKEKLVSSNQQGDMQVVKSIENLGSTIKNSLVTGLDKAGKTTGSLFKSVQEKTGGIFRKLIPKKEDKNEEIRNQKSFLESLKGLGSKIGEIAKGVGGKIKEKFGFLGGIGTFLKAALIGGGLLVLLKLLPKFFESDLWKQMSELITGKLLPALESLYENFIKPFALYISGKLTNLFADINDDTMSAGDVLKENFGFLITALGGLAVYLYPKATFGLVLKAAKFIGTVMKKNLLPGLKGLGGSLAKAGGSAKGAVGGLAKKATGSGGFARSASAMTKSSQPGKVVGMAKGIQTMGKSAGKGIGGFISGILKGIGAGLTAIANPAALVGLAAVSAAILAISAALRILKPAFEPIGKMFESFGETIKSVFEGLGTTIESIGSGIAKIIEGIGDSLANVIGKITEMKTAGTDATTKQIEKLSQIPADTMFKAALGIEALKEALEGFGGSTFSKIGDSLFGGKGPIDKIIELAKNTEPLMKAAAAIQSIGQVGTDYAAVTGKDIPRRAMGGPVQDNELYLVGEKGPELFRPSTSGQIDSAARTDDIMKTGMDSLISSMSNGGQTIVNNVSSPTQNIENTTSTTAMLSSISEDFNFRKLSTYSF